jgi:hypothetical protein
MPENSILRWYYFTGCLQQPWIAGRQYTIKNIGPATVTVSCASKTERIDGSATRVLDQWAAITVQCGTIDGTTYQWFITARN